MTTLPQTLAMIALFASTTLASAASSADFNNDGVVDTNDLLVMTSNLNQPCVGNCPWDLNGDGYTDSSDLLVLMGQWGEVSNNQGDNQSNSSNSQSNHSSQDLSWQGQGPILLDGIYYDQLSRNQQRRDLANELNQGELAKAWATENNIDVQPIVYNGAVDWYADGAYSDDDRARFKNWIDENVPADYSGPLCLDMEGQWWSVFDTSNQNVMDTVIDFYIEGLEYAQSLRPDAKIGYWGLPKKSHTKITSTTADVSRLLQASTGLFPDVYDMNPIGNGSSRLRKHVEKTMEMVNGQVPVYVQVSPRYKASNGQFSELHTIDEFMRDQVDASLAAVWTDENNKEHRIQGVALWDAYVYFWWYTNNWTLLDNETRKAMWNELDEYHVASLGRMKTSVDTAKAEADVRLANSQEEEAETQAVAEAAAEAQAASALVEEQTAQQLRLARRINSATSKVSSKSKSYKRSSKSYRNSRKSMSKSSRAFAQAKRHFSRGSKQYKQALANYKKTQARMRTASRSFRTQRNAYRAARAKQNTLTNQWSANSAQWSAMASAANSLTSN